MHKGHAETFLTEFKEDSVSDLGQQGPAAL